MVSFLCLSVRRLLSDSTFLSAGPNPSTQPGRTLRPRASPSTLTLCLADSTSRSKAQATSNRTALFRRASKSFNASLRGSSTDWASRQMAWQARPRWLDTTRDHAAQMACQRGRTMASRRPTPTAGLRARGEVVVPQLRTAQRHMVTLVEAVGERPFQWVGVHIERYLKLAAQVAL
jgi:hypothetical protein